MENGLKIFENEEFGNVRVVMRDGEPWFAAKDVAGALEYADASNASRLFAVVPECWKGVNPIHTPGGVQEMLCISEQGLYFFLGRSDKPKALPYQMWVAGDIMPAIRKTGGYGVKDKIGDPNIAAVTVTQMVLRQAKLADNQVAIGMSNTYRKLTGIDVLEAAGIPLPSPVQKQALTPTEIGKELGDYTPREINRLLIEKGYQTKRINGGYDPTKIGELHALLLDTAKRHSDGTPIKQLKWYTTILPIIKEWLA